MQGSTLDIAINLADGVPIFRQVVTRINFHVASGALGPDAPLPSIRALAQALKVAPNTIAKAYGELEAAGVVRRRRGLGTFICAASRQIVEAERRRIVEMRIDALLVEARQLNFTVEALLALMHRRQAFALTPDANPQ